MTSKSSNAYKLRPCVYFWVVSTNASIRFRIIPFNSVPWKLISGREGRWTALGELHTLRERERERDWLFHCRSISLSEPEGFISRRLQKRGRNLIALPLSYLSCILGAFSLNRKRISSSEIMGLFLNPVGNGKLAFFININDPKVANTKQRHEWPLKMLSFRRKILFCRLSFHLEAAAH